MNAKNPKFIPGRFCWNELVTTNEAAAKKFYAGLFGWKPKPFGKGMAYTLLKNRGKNAAGMMKSPEPGCPARWVPYVLVKDVDASIKKAKKLRAKILAGPFEVPTVGRIAVLGDPQGAIIGILKPAV